MKFYGRLTELELLENTRKLAEKSAKMTIIVGRRRIGKTSLAIKAFEKQTYLYLFIARKNETLLCKEFTEEIERAFGKPVIGEFRSFVRLFEYLLIQAQSNPFTLIIDEFQEFYQVNPVVYSEIQNLWDKYKSSSKMNLVLCGSIFTLMKKIFEDAKEPLFGRADEKIHLKPFDACVMKEIFTDQQPEGKMEDFLAFYTISGGVAKYVEIFADKSLFSLEQILSEIFRENSILIEEGKNILIEEFGKDYATYFSILSLIASSKTSRSEIESILEKNTGGYLDRLENEYQIIKSLRPVFSKPGGRIQKYFIDDNFLNFWFRFVYKYRSAVEIGNFLYVRSVTERDFDTYSGPFLEKYFREKLIISGKYSLIGRYWNRKNENELDIVALNELEQKAIIAEVKRNPKKINIHLLRIKAKAIQDNLMGFDVSFKGFSLKDM
ncbi:MAG: ATP-binding protein [Bacteroidales bacterium]|nr:ATP-binding protein [Bacteroidales bacterium]